ncbi:hypothetical protein CL620_00780 [archaeon]|mgnify:CR=1 FL=1|jgi:hypothetical protein|nr:hypothetical protein [archaeon]|tara:strand:+ start:227 stop:475 length:249 start_codon:yes stop_codon:yes gene_type:complete
MTKDARDFTFPGQLDGLVPRLEKEFGDDVKIRENCSRTTIEIYGLLRREKRILADAMYVNGELRSARRYSGSFYRLVPREFV